MASSWDDFKTSMKSFFNSAADKTEEYAKIGKIKVDIVNLKRSLDRQYQEMGKAVFDALKKDDQTALGGKAEIQKLMAGIQKQIDHIKDKEKEIEKIRAEARKKAVSKEAKKKETKKEEKKESEKKASAPAKKKTAASGKSVQIKETAADKKPADSGPKKDS
ncbi:MAG TPA: hypothetical protein ENN03_07610 [bacterium]|nr:hypothetical protein [bacterium]